MATAPGETTDDTRAHQEFWEERHLCFLTSMRPDGTPHVVPVGVTYDPGTRTARVITNRASRKVRNVLAASPARVSLSQVDGGRWTTLEGTAVVSDDREEVADAVERYARRYRQPQPNPERVVILVTVTRAMGSVKPAPFAD